MKATVLHEHQGLRTFAVVLETGEEVMNAIRSFAGEQQLRASQFTAIGAFSRAVVAYFDWPAKEYRRILFDEQVEVLSLLGDITFEEHRRNVHAHVVIGKADATAHGGHLFEGQVRPTLEMVMTELPAHLHRRFDPESGLNLIGPPEDPVR
jgi:predicted DNA-binding protein with PD1-like motif